ncbi:MAG: hypothetical protein H8E82_04710 [Candidatus Marinimicrobia bacterium]|nr:hypothetical protein [Candidatus Neomarinimicrobiota bacterium]
MTINRLRNDAVHLSAIPLRSIAPGDLCRRSACKNPSISGQESYWILQ